MKKKIYHNISCTCIQFRDSIEKFRSSRAGSKWYETINGQALYVTTRSVQFTFLPLFHPHGCTALFCVRFHARFHRFAQHYAPPFCWRHVTRYFLPGSFIVDESPLHDPLCFVLCITAWPLFTVTRLIYRHRFFKQVSRSIFIMQLEEKNLFNLSTIRG